MRRIAFINHKGGCGKSTTLFHIAGELAIRGNKVLVIDTDKQCDTTNAFLAEEESNYDFDSNVLTIIDYFEGKPLNECIKKNYIKVGNKKPEYKGIDVIPSDVRLENQELVLKLMSELKTDIIYEDFESYDFVLFDCPPSNRAVEKLVLGYLATEIITPMTCDINAIRGYSELLKLLNDMRVINPALQICGIFLSMFSANRKKHKQYLDILRERCGKTFIDVQIPLSSDVVVAIEDKGQPMAYYKKTYAKEKFELLVDEILLR